MADWNNPQTSQLYTDHFASIREKDDHLAVMFDGVSDTNLPDGTIRIQSSQGYRLEKWDAVGTTWNAITIALGNLVTELTGLTSAEVTQLQAIGGTTISATQWGYLGGFDQNLRTTDAVVFNGLTLNSPFATQFAATHWNAQITDDSNTSIISVRDSANNEIGSVTAQNLNGLGAGTLHLLGWDGILVGSPTGGAQGPGTINAADLYLNGSPVVAESDAGSVYIAVLGSSVDNTLPRFSGASGGVIQTSGVTIDDDDNIFGYGQKIDFRTANFTVSAAENGKNVDCAKGTAFTITVPDNAAVPLPVGFSSTYVQAGAGQVTFVEDTNVTIQSNSTLSLATQWAAATLYKRSTDEWVLIGDLG